MEDNQLYLMLGRIDGKLDHALKRQDAHDAAIEALGRRVSTLERSKALVIGAATALSTIIGYCLPFVKDWLLK